MDKHQNRWVKKEKGKEFPFQDRCQRDYETVEEEKTEVPQVGDADDMKEEPNLIRGQEK